MLSVESTKENHLRQELTDLFRAALGLVLNKGPGQSMKPGVPLEYITTQVMSALQLEEKQHR